MITAILAAKNVEMPLAHALHALVPAAADGLLREVIVIESGSRDGTAVVADAAGCELMASVGPAEDDLRRAAERAKGDWLLFLSPHVVLDGGWHVEADDYIARVSGHGRARESAAVFRLAEAEDGLGARLSEWLALLSTRLLSAPREEQGLLISRAMYRELGGHRRLAAIAWPDLARRIGRRRLTLLRKSATLHRPAETGKAARPFRALRRGLCLALLVLRLPPAFIGRLAA